jgi:TolB-like protein/DNA-binding winged helix-turn-helix (wHTH) protein
VAQWQNPPHQEHAVHEPNSTSHVLRFGVFEADVRSRELRKQGVRIRLQEQPFQVLWLLLERAGDVVTRDELRQKVWPSSVFVDFDHGLNNAVARVRDALDDTAGSPRFIETLPRHGYRFICPVVRDMPAEAPPASSPVAPPAKPATRPRTARLTIAAGACLAAALGAGLWLANRDDAVAPQAPLPIEPSVAVLPFETFGNGTEDAGDFADGLSEELINRLAGIHGLKVAGRTSSFAFRGKNLPAHEIAAALNVNHLLEGSVRQSASRMRVTAQLIDARNNHHMWSQTYDREFKDIFKVQEDIATAVAMALKVKLVEGDLHRIREHGTRDPEAYRRYLMALTQLRGHGPRNIPEARRLFEAALARDPQFADAHAGLAHFYFRKAWLSMQDLEESVRLGRAAAERAVELDPDSSEALVAMANYEVWRWRFRDDSAAYTRAMSGYQRAIEFAPASAPAHFNYARAVEWDEPDLSLRLFERAAELDPLFSHAQGRAASRLSERGLHDAERQRLQELDREPLLSRELVFKLYRGVLEMRLGNLDEALRLLAPLTDFEFSLLRRSMFLSLGDTQSARACLPAAGDALTRAVRDAAELSMQGRYPEAFGALDRHRGEYPTSRVLDAAAARLALVAGLPQRALPILTGRLPDLARGIGPVTARNVLPALDLATAYAATGHTAEARALLGRVAAYLDGPQVPWQPMFTYLRARTHALAGEPALALEALERAYARGFRQTWGIDLNPGPLYYLDSIDAEPGFNELKSDPRFRQWRERMRAESALQLARYRASESKVLAQKKP